MPAIIFELKHAFRGLRKSPGFTTIAVIALALGIGANSAVFSVINGVLLQPLPYRDPSRLVQVRETSPDFPSMSVAYLNFVDWRQQNRTFAGMGAIRWEDYDITTTDRPEHLSGKMISASLFRVLGISPLRGRDFESREDRVGAEPVVIISGGLWKRRFGANPAALGSPLTLNGRDYTIIGVMPDDFQIFGTADLYTLIGQWDDILSKDREMHPGITVLGRLQPGVTLTQAQADLNAIAAHLAEAYPKSNARHGVRTTPLARDIVGDVQSTLLILLGAVAFVLLIACANVANLLLARSIRRRREMAVRVAMGATRLQTARYLFAESVLLALAGGAAGLIIAKWGTRALLVAVPGGVPRMDNVGIDVWVLGFTLAISILTGLVFGIVPALQSSSDLAETLKEGSRGSTSGRQRMRIALVVSEVAATLVLLVGAGLMLRTIWLLSRVDPGFNTHRLLTFSMSLSPANVATPERITQSLNQIDAALRSVPGVTQASLTTLVPLGSNDNEIPFYVNGRPRPTSQGDMQWALLYCTGPAYRETMGIPLLRGRYLNQQDVRGAAPVVVIDDAMARAIFPGEDPIGKSIVPAITSDTIDPEVSRPMRIVGVVGHVKHWGLASDETNQVRNQIYLPVEQIPPPFLKASVSGATYLVRSAADPTTLLSGIRQAVAAAGNNQPVYAVQTLDRIVSDGLAGRRFSMLLLSVFAGLALLLAAVGIYGVVSYGVAQQRQEIGIRIALGADRRDVLRVVVNQGMTAVLIGLAVGFLGALVLTRLMTRLLFQVSPGDPLTFAAVALVLATVALLACLIPALRATRVDPAEALRYA